MTTWHVDYTTPGFTHPDDRQLEPERDVCPWHPDSPETRRSTP